MTAGSAKHGGTPGSALASGRIVAAFGRQYLVETHDGAFRRCVTRGKQASFACGDRVQLTPTASGEGVIESLEPRSTLFARAVAHRTKLIAANATQVAIVVAGEPSFSDELVCRILAAAEHQGLRAFIILNKADLEDAARRAGERLEPFRQAGYGVVEIAAKRDVTPLARELAGEVTVLVGQSGMGKSTIVNALVPGANAATREISRFLDSGRHTTTHSRLYPLGGETAIIDCPGLKEFGLADLAPAEIEAGFMELAGHLGRCRFADCRHRTEPGCAVRAAAEDGVIHPRRLELMHRIIAAEGAR